MGVEEQIVHVGGEKVEVVFGTRQNDDEKKAQPQTPQQCIFDDVPE